MSIAVAVAACRDEAAKTAESLRREYAELGLRFHPGQWRDLERDIRAAGKSGSESPMLAEYRNNLASLRQAMDGASR